jgi:ABC-type bacteriocin/lantibiotic exporter with double-glycine peptidase domain
LILAFLEVVGVASVAPFIAVLTSPELIHENDYLTYLYNFFGVDSDYAFIILLGIVVVISILIANSTQSFITWKITNFSELQQHRVSVRLLQKYLSQPYSFFLDKNTSELGKNILTEVGNAVSGVIMQSLLVLSKLVVGLFIIILLIIIDPQVAIIATVFLGGSYWIIYKLVKQRLLIMGTAKTEAGFQAFKTTSEAMAAIKEIKLRGSEKKFIDRYFIPSKALAKYSANITLISTLPRYLLEVVAFGGMILIVIYLLSKNIDHYSTIIPMISLYAMAGYRLMPALQIVYSGMTRIKFSIPAFNIVVDAFSQTDTKDLTQTNQDRLSFENKIEIKQVSFSYKNPNAFVLDNLNLKITHNTTVGLMGSTGAGKTTLIDILLGLLTPDNGSISVDQKEINLKNLSAWQKNIGYVPQNIYLTDDTIERNIAFSEFENTIDTEQVTKAAKMANLDVFINTLPEKYKTFVGERGIRLSGGQRQRIGIARAIYHNPKVLVFDEATSSLDGITENAIMDAIQNLSHKKTIIIIAHRLSTLIECDIIHMLANGKIIDSGTYTQLIKNNKEFRKMSKQF